MRAQDVKVALAKKANPQKVSILQRFFKTAKGEYGEGDRFLGVVVPEQRKIAKQFRTLSFADVVSLLKSPMHEHRMTALLIWCDQFLHGDEAMQGKIYTAYLKLREFINNWDLVDVTCPIIVGRYMFQHRNQRKRLYALASAKSVWDRRIAILVTYYFIRQGDYKDTIRLSKKLIADKQDLIHKAVGWMLREAGNRDVRVLRSFLSRYAKAMPRTMLRYAIEKLPLAERTKWMYV